MSRTFEIEESNAGCRLVMFEDGIEVGGGVFPIDAWHEAYEAGLDWLG